MLLAQQQPPPPPLALLAPTRFGSLLSVSSLDPVPAAGAAATACVTSGASLRQRGRHASGGGSSAALELVAVASFSAAAAGAAAGAAAAASASLHPSPAAKSAPSASAAFLTRPLASQLSFHVAAHEQQQLLQSSLVRDALPSFDLATAPAAVASGGSSYSGGPRSLLGSLPSMAEWLETEAAAGERRQGPVAPVVEWCRAAAGMR